MLHKKFAKLHSVSGSEPNSQKIVMYSAEYLISHRPHGDQVLCLFVASVFLSAD